MSTRKRKRDWTLHDAQIPFLKPRPAIGWSPTAEPKPLPEMVRVERRRLSWEAFYRQRPDLRPANDNRSCVAA